MSQPAAMNDAEILEKLREILGQSFDIEAERVQPDVRLYEDLDLDSIDAVDMAIQLQNFTGKRIRPEEFKNVRTVGDVMNAVRGLLAAA